MNQNENPAQVQYREWRTALDRPLRQLKKQRRPTNRETGFTAWWYSRSIPSPWSGGIVFPYGRTNWALVVEQYDHNDEPVITLAHTYGSRMTPVMKLAADGRFQVSIRSWGQRHALEALTFLGYGWDRQQYRWAVGTEEQSFGWAAARDPHRALPHLSERDINGMGWMTLFPKMETMSGPLVWKIIADSLACPPGTCLNETVHEECVRSGKRSRAIIRDNDAWQEKRYRRLLNDERRKMGLPSLQRAARLRSGNQTLTPAESVAQLSALLDVDSPAKAHHLPATRPTEAQKEKL